MRRFGSHVVIIWVFSNTYCNTNSLPKSPIYTLAQKHATTEISITGKKSVKTVDDVIFFIKLNCQRIAIKIKQIVYA